MQRPARHIFLSGSLTVLQSAFVVHSENEILCILKVVYRIDLMILLGSPTKNWMANLPGSVQQSADLGQKLLE